MVQEFPTVLFVDQDEPALDGILTRIEPIFYSMSLRSPEALPDYVKKWEPDVIVLSDRIDYRKKETSAFLAELRETYRGPILILTECASEQERARWRERGATDCLLHPTRVVDRLDDLARKILEVTSPDFSKTP